MTLATKDLLPLCICSSLTFTLFVLPFLLQFYLSNDIILMVLLSKYVRNAINVHIQTYMQTGTHTHHQSLLISLSKSKNITSEESSHYQDAEIFIFMIPLKKLKQKKSSEKMNWHSKQPSWEFILINQNIQLSIYANNFFHYTLQKFLRITSTFQSVKVYLPSDII